MSIWGNILEKIGISSHSSRDDEINRSMENSSQEFNDALGHMRDKLKKNNETTEHLRQSIALAKERTSSFADFERLSSRRRNGHHD
jgi:hypothetical protein